MAVLTAGALLACACGGGGDGGVGGDGADTFADMLALVPDTPGNRVSLTIENIAAVREGTGITTPRDPTDADALIEYVISISQGPIADSSMRPPLRSPGVTLGAFLQPFHTRITDLPAWQDEVGFTVADLDANVLTGLPPEQLIIWVGSLDPEEMAGAVAADPMWSADLRNMSHAGFAHWCWTDDPGAPDLERVTPMRPLGRGGCMAAFDGLALRTFTLEAIEMALETRAGERTSLAGVEALRVAAEALDRQGAYAASFTMDAEPFSAADAASRGLDLSGLDQPLLGRWEAMAAGGGFDEEGEYLVVVLVYADGEDAAANADVLEEIISEGRSAYLAAERRWVPDVADAVRSVSAEGNVVVAVLGGFAIAHAWPNIATVPDTLVIWGE
jgi:hypothetical protein